LKSIDKMEFQNGINEFEKREKRDAMYKVATFLVANFWGNPPNMADGLGVLLLTWNQAFYRYGLFDFNKLEQFINNNFQKIDNFRKRSISSLSTSDEVEIKLLFNELLDVLQIDTGKLKGRKSPVAVSKTLHLLAPNFFPLWDNKISIGYGCYYNEKPHEKYVSFCKIMKTMAESVKDYVTINEKSILKLIDEYNYSKYTQKWI